MHASHYLDTAFRPRHEQIKSEKCSLIELYLEDFFLFFQIEQLSLFLCGTLMSQSSLQNQCELFIQGSNPRLYRHLICGYATALMALMPSDRCPRSAAQVRLHLVTPCKTGIRWLAAHSPQVMPYESMHYSRCTLKNLMPNVDIQYLPPLLKRAVKMNIMCLSG